MGASESPDKPFDISKRDVWEAWLKVKENQGAPGVDGQSIADFHKDLKNNLYKVWNRMSSGSYLPSPVRAVEIDKPHGEGMRTLGIPTVADRIAQTVVARHLEERVEPVFHPDSYGYRPGRSAHDAVQTARRRCWQYDWVLDLDIREFFDTVPGSTSWPRSRRTPTPPGCCCTSSGGWPPRCSTRTGRGSSGTGELRRDLRSRRCWRTCSATTHSTSG